MYPPTTALPVVPEGEGAQFDHLERHGEQTVRVVVAEVALFGEGQAGEVVQARDVAGGEARRVQLLAIEGDALVGPRQHRAQARELQILEPLPVDGLMLRESQTAMASRFVAGVPPAIIAGRCRRRTVPPWVPSIETGNKAGNGAAPPAHPGPSGDTYLSGERTQSITDTTIELPVTGMICASCVARVERAIGKAEGVDKAAVNLATEKATVTFDPGGSAVRRRPRRCHRGRRLRRGDRAADVADRRHDLRGLREPGGEGAACPAGVLRADVNLATEKATVVVHPRAGEPPGPGGRRARRRLRRRGAGAGRRRGGCRCGGRRTRGRPRRRLPPAQAEGHRRVRAQSSSSSWGRCSRTRFMFLPHWLHNGYLLWGSPASSSSGSADSSTPPPGRRWSTARPP